MAKYSKSAVQRLPTLHWAYKQLRQQAATLQQKTRPGSARLSSPNKTNPLPPHGVEKDPTGQSQLCPAAILRQPDRLSP